MAMSETWASRLAPEPFRDFLPYTSTSALKVIHATQVLRRALDVVQHFSQPGERAHEATRLAASLGAAGFAGKLQIATEAVLPLSTADLSPDERRQIGERVLALYFHLLHWDGPLFLDLRYMWQCQPTPGFSHRIERLLKRHFEPAAGSTMRFEIAQFRSTFDTIFKQAEASRSRLHPELAFLGVELIGLYLTLEALNVELDPRAAFHEAR